MKSLRIAVLAVLIPISSMVASSASGQTYSVLYNFDDFHGANPMWPGIMAQGRDGSLYSTTYQGGPSNSGVIFKISTGGELSLLYSFEGAEGSAPASGLMLAPDGTFYGTTSFGGNHNRGIIFRLAPEGSGTILYNFSGGHDGGEPYAPPIEGTDGSFYGATAFGGFAAVYKITRSGEFTLLGTPPGPSTSPLLQGSGGSFYGTTVTGGNHKCDPISGCGTVFRMTRDGMVTGVHAFAGTDGAYPISPVIEGSDGNLYGTAVQGGSSLGGVVFKLSARGSLTILHNFRDASCPNDGQYPIAGLIQASDGNFYGATSKGGKTDAGVIFEVGADGSYSVLYDFDGGHGYGPVSNLIQHTNGKIYGMTNQGGTSNSGVVYSLDLGLPPFVALARTWGRVGQAGGILGQGFTGATSVSLNGVPAPFKVVSDTYLTATVPPGATSGYVTVTTPSGTLTSNKKFIVLP